MSINKIIYEVFKSSTVHGLPNLFLNHNRLVQLIWLLFFLGTSSICAFVIYENITQFLQHEVISRIEVKFYNQMVFPMITICRPNPFATRLFEDLLSNIFNKDGLKEFHDYDLNTSFSNTKLKFYSKKNYALLNAANFNFSKLVTKKVENVLDDIILTCLYNFQLCDMKKDFEEYYDYFNGNCFRFNSQKLINGLAEPIKLSPQGGLLNGLQFEFFVGTASENNQFFSSENGLTLFIHNQSDLSHSNSGIKISPGYSTFVVLNKYTTIQIAKPFSDCTNDLNREDSYDSDLFRKMLETNKTYSQTNCRFMCYQKYLGDTCGCQLYSYKFYTNMSACLSLNSTNCQLESIKKFSEFQLAKKCDCPLECQKTYYDYTYSFNEYPSRYYANILGKHKLVKSKFANLKNITYENLRPRIAALNIYYDELKESFITQEKRMILIDLISGIGGILGLFLGMSFLSFMESFEILLKIFLFKIEIKKVQDIVF